LSGRADFNATAFDAGDFHLTASLDELAIGGDVNPLALDVGDTARSEHRKSTSTLTDETLDGVGIRVAGSRATAAVSVSSASRP
jgi:hypothetical protein